MINLSYNTIFSTKHFVLHSALSLILLAILLIPAHLAFKVLEEPELYLPHGAATLSLGIVLVLILIRLPARLAAVSGSLILGFMLFIRLALYVVAALSGSGFTDEVFIHLEPRSFAVSWEQDPGLWSLLFGLLVALSFAVAWLIRGLQPWRHKKTGMIAIAALSIALLGRQGLPEWQLAQAAWHWYQPKSLDLDPEILQRWQDSGMVNVDLIPKNKLHATPSGTPRNLILIYLESLGQRVIEHPDYPNLMPHLAQRLSKNSLLRDYHAASFITIEGITNSQCGTLIPFERNSDSLAGFDNLAEDQVCLGDVLHRAGYTQIFLGGAEQEFAGKGAFLSAHGYDRVMGFHEWQRKGHSADTGGWGLGDPQLFDEALAELEQLRALNTPFNLTLLTLGTHLPGFPYAECHPYAGSNDPFINALHCSDQLLEQFLTRIEQAGYLEDTVVVVTADHHVFPNAAMKQLFGNDAIRDRRLPFMVLTPDELSESAQSGANYDLAPTVLELLGIKSNAGFALGRSLFQSAEKRDYFLTRYKDIYQGNPIAAEEDECQDQLPSPPLSICQKEQVMTLLRVQNAAFSQSPSTHLSCNAVDPATITIPYSASESLQFFIHQEDQAPRFSWQSRPQQETRSGLFLAAFSEQGALLDRQFIPQEEAVLSTSPPVVEGASHYLLAWRSRGHRLPSWLQGHGSPRGIGAIISAQGTLLTLPWQASEAAITFTLASPVCELWSGNTGTDIPLQQSLQETAVAARRLSEEDDGFCSIQDWGKKETPQGQRFNEQPDGQSAFWLKTDCAPVNTVILFDGKPLETTRRLPVMTAVFDADPYLQKPGEWQVELYDPETENRQPVGIFHVLSDTATPDMATTVSP